MNIFAIGDLHLSFGETIEKPMDIFGPSWNNHWQRLEENWRKLVGEDDIVIIPGDISWAMHLEDAMADLAWIDSLPGKKLISKGNHDLWWSSRKKMDGLFPSITFLQNNAYAGDGFVIIASRGWICPTDPDFKAEDQKIFNRELIRLNLAFDDAKSEVKRVMGEAVLNAYMDGEKPFKLIGALHYPPAGNYFETSDIMSFFEEKRFDKVVFGHLHGEAAFVKAPQGIINGVEYRLCSLDSLKCVPWLVAKIDKL